jgi:hypothetical protein
VALLALGCGLVAAPVAAAVLGGARALPYPEAVQRSRAAAEAVLAEAGSASCLRGKITNALLGLSSSCEAVGERNPLCQLADAVVLRTGDWDRTFLEGTARQVLQLSEAPATAATAPAAAAGR